MRIAIYSDTYPPQVNGVSMFVEKTERGLRERGHEVKVFSPRSLPSMPFWGYPGERLVIPLGFSLLGVHKFRPDIIHVHTPFGVGWEAIYAAAILSVPIVGTHHTFYDHYLKHIYLNSESSKKMSWAYTVTFYNRCDAVTCPSQSLALALAERGLARPVRVVPNCIDTDEFFPNDAGRNGGQNLVYMGRLSYEKSIDVVIKAFAKILDKYPAAALTIVGDGPEKRNLEELAAVLRIESRINFVGVKRGRELVQFLQKGSVFVTASESENQPLSILEAMAVGLPVVGVRALGVPEVVRDGENGFLVEPQKPDLLAAAVLEILHDDGLRQRLGIAAHATAQNYARPRIAEMLEKIYEELIKQGK